MSGTDFAKWRKSWGLSLTEAAKLLGVGRRTIMGYLKKNELPPVVAIACRALARDKHVFAAHYVPARKMNDDEIIWFEWPAAASGSINVEIIDYH